MSAKFPSVIRCIKHSSYATLKESGRHQWREKHVPNADKKRLHLNTDLRPVSGSQQLVEAVKKRAALATENKEGVPCLEYMITANHAAFKSNGGYVDDEQFINDAIEFLEEKHGKENIIALNIQRDEKAIHLVAFVVPLISIENKKVKRSVIVGKDENGKQIREIREVAVKDSVKLSASHFVDGRAKLAKLHTEFHQKVGKKHGLDRGIERSLAENVKIKDWYSAINAKFEHPTIQPKHIEPKVINEGRFGIGREVESYEDVCKRLNAGIHKYYAPIVLAASTAKIDRQRSVELSLTLRREQQRYSALVAAFDQLDPERKEQAMQTIRDLIELQKKSEAEQESAKHQLLWTVIQNMRSADPELSDMEAYERADALWGSGTGEFEEWLAWTPPKPAEGSGGSGGGGGPAPVPKPRPGKEVDDGYDFGR